MVEEDVEEDAIKGEKKYWEKGGKGGKITEGWNETQKRRELLGTLCGSLKKGETY